MWDSLWIGASLATMVGNARYGAIENGAIAIEDGRIAWIGSIADLPDPPDLLAEHVFNVRDCWITPGLIDCHTHLVYAGSRSKDFEMRLGEATRSEIMEAGGGVARTIRLTREATETELSDVTYRRASALAMEGVTTIEIKSGYGLDLQNELKILRAARSMEGRLPVEVVTTFGLYAIPDQASDRRSTYVDLVCESVLPEVAQRGLITAIDVQLDELGFTKEEADKLFRSARELGLTIRVHTDELSDFSGAEFAARYGARTADHLEYVSTDGVSAMAKAGMVAVLLPGNTHVLQRKRKPPVHLFREYGVPMAVATNCNPGPSPTTSILLMMNMACVLYGLTPEEALASTTTHAAAALGLQDTHGTLEVGKVADFAVWDIESPGELSYYLGFNPLNQVVKGGKVVLNRNLA